MKSIFKMLGIAAFAAVITFALTACTQSGGPQIPERDDKDVTTGDNIPVTVIQMLTGPSTVVEGDTQPIVARVLPLNASDQSVTWSSDNESVATVSSSGVVTAVTPGTATITVKTNDGGKTNTVKITVAARVYVNGISAITPSSAGLPNLAAGTTGTLTATVSPADATNKRITWSSGDTSVATVSAAGVVTGVSPGTATITATAADTHNGTYSNSYTVYVTQSFNVISITYEHLTDPEMTITNAPTTLSLLGPSWPTVTLSNAAAFSAVSWHINGITHTGTSFTLDKGDTLYNRPGSYTLTLEVVQSSTTYSRVIPFTVTP